MEIEVRKLRDSFISRGEGQHPTYTFLDWKEELLASHTDQNYWEWVYWKTKMDWCDFKEQQDYVDKTRTGE